MTNETITNTEGRSYFQGAWESLTPQEQALFERVVDACGVDTCAPSISSELAESRKEKNTYGSCFVAATVFLSILDEADWGKWYPVIIEDMSFKKDYILRHHVSLYNGITKRLLDNEAINKLLENRRIHGLMDFTSAARFGGLATISVHEQKRLLDTKFLSDRGLEGRLNIGLLKAGSNYNAAEALDIFQVRFNEGLRRNIAAEVVKTLAMQ